MASRLSKMNSIAAEILDHRFKELLLQGHWPEVEYKKSEWSQSYNLFEYAETRARFAKAAHDSMVARGFEFGLWQNARNTAYADAVKAAIGSLTVEQVDQHDRFKVALID